MKADEIDDSSAPLIEHLAELRTRILYAMGAFILCFVIGFIVWKPIFNFLSEPICTALSDRGEECQLILVKVQEGFFVAMRIGMLAGFAMAFPIIAFQMWRFIAPGLYKSEKNAFLPFIVASPVMFLLGSSFAYYLILPFAFAFFLSFQDGLLGAGGAGTLAEAATQGSGVEFQGSIEAFLSLTMSFVFAFGLCFQLPVLLTLMGRAGLITSRGLKATRKYAVVAILVVAAIVTPPDAISQIILFSAIYPLYEISIFLIARFERDREAQARADGTWVDDEEEQA